MVDVLNDAFALVANLGQTVIPAGSSLLASKPLPTDSQPVVIVDTASEDEDDKEEALVTPRDAVFADKEEFLVLA